MSCDLLLEFQALEDPRILGMVQYPLDEILFVVLAGLLCQLEDIEDIEIFGREQLGWLQQFLPFSGGVAPAQTIRRVLARLDGRSLERLLVSWVRGLGGRDLGGRDLGGTGAAKSGVIAIDGKAVRGHGTLHMVNAYASEAGLVLAARATAGKGHEIAGIAEVLDLLQLEGMIVTTDALGTQTDIVETILSKKGEYVLALKGNQGSLHEDVTCFFADTVLLQSCAETRCVEDGHGRIETRTLYAADAEWVRTRHPRWRGLRSIAMLESVREDKKTKAYSTTTRFYIASLPPNPEALLKAARAHWSVENNAHWVLDVLFNEDAARARKDYEAQNMAILRRIALNILKQNKEKIPLKQKRTKAAFNPHYRKKLLGVNN
jgi:predicted transposase YbfD/YdcC